MDPCKENEPQIINHMMIARCLEEQGLKGELGRLARAEGIPWNEVLHIRLEFMKIIRIDHVWVLPSLTMLSLSNNLIEEIVNIDMLVHLEELDLSFNKIKKIENLDALVKLEILNLFNNKIELIENMDTLANLTIFSIGNNLIDDRNNVLYLRQFKKLKSVNMAGNPCAQVEDFRNFVATFLPRIVYYEYKMIDETEREEGKELYKRKIIEVEEIESVIREKQERLEAELIEAELHADSFVEFLGSDHLFQQLFEGDNDGKVFLKIGEELDDYYKEFRESVLNLTMQIFENGQRMYRERKEEVKQFKEITEGAKLKNQEDHIEMMDIFMAEKEELSKTIRDEKATYGFKDFDMHHYTNIVEDTREEYFALIHQNWKKLMGLELTLYEQVEEANETFETVLTEMVNNFIEMAQGFFAAIRQAQTIFHEQLTDMTGRMLMVNMYPPELATVFTDRDTLNNALTGSNDFHLLVIDNREDRLVKRAKGWLSNLVNDLQKDEIVRYREKILEINHFLHIQRDEFEDWIILQELNPESLI